MKQGRKIGLLFAATQFASAATAATPPAAAVVSGVQVGIGTCGFSPSRSGDDKGRILSVIAATAVSKGVNLLTSAISEAAKAKTWTAAGSRNFQATSESFPQCVQIARGKFYADQAAIGPWANSWTSEQRAALTANGLFLAEAPDFFFEGEFTASDDKSALSIRPIYSVFAKPIGKRWLRPGSNRGVALFFAITPPGTKPNLESAPAATLILGEQHPPSAKRYPPPGPSYRSPLESTWFTLSKADIRKPFTIQALVTETQDADAFLGFVASVLGDDKAKTALTTEAQQLLIPSAAATAETTAATAAAKAANNADQLLATAIAKLEQCKAAPSSTAVAAGAQAKMALRDYSLADQALDQDARTGVVGEAQISQLDLTKPTTLAPTCGTILQGIIGNEG